MPTNSSANTPDPYAADKAVAEIEKINAERDFHLNNARVAKILGDQEEIVLNGRRRVETAVLASDAYHHVYLFDHDVDDESVKDCVKSLTLWSRNDPGCDIEIQLNTQGGSIFAGFALVDSIREVRRRGHRVTIVVYGHAASMGAVILQAADHRVMGENAFALVHQGSMYMGGDYGQNEDSMKLFDKLHDRILTLLSERSLINRDTIKKNWRRADWWLNAAETKKAGFVDEVR